MCRFKRAVPRLELQKGLLCPWFLLSALWLLPLASRADSGHGESASFAIDNGSHAQSGAFAIDNRLAAADFDRDGDVDLDDFGLFHVCTTGPAVAYWGGCATADLDLDYDVDQSDFGLFQQCYSGKSRLADPDCAD